MSKAGREWKSMTKLIEVAHMVLAEQHPQTLRQVFYALVSRIDPDTGQTFLLNTKERALLDYSNLSNALVKARKQNRVPWEWMDDRSRPVYHGLRGTWSSLAEYAAVMRVRLQTGSSYTLDHWLTQANEVELWCEKDATVGSFLDITREWGVTVRTGRGNQSATNIQIISKNFQSITKTIYVLYFGDHDPSGRSIPDSWRDRVRDKQYGGGCQFHFERVAIHKSDIARYHLPVMRIKPDDSGGESFRRKFGPECVELDALPVKVLRERVLEGILKHIDMRAWKRSQHQEAQARRIIQQKWRGSFPVK